MPAGLYADWNDCLRLGADGRIFFRRFPVLLRNDYSPRIWPAYKGGRRISQAILKKSRRDMARRFRMLYWDTDRFIRGFTEKGERIGGPPGSGGKYVAESTELVCHQRTGRTRTGRHSASERIRQTEHRLWCNLDGSAVPWPMHLTGLWLLFTIREQKRIPEYSRSHRAGLYLPKRSADTEIVPLHILKRTQPSAQNDRSEIRQLEPYCYGQFTEGRASVNFGRSHVQLG